MLSNNIILILGFSFGILLESILIAFNFKFFQGLKYTFLGWLIAIIPISIITIFMEENSQSFIDIFIIISTFAILFWTMLFSINYRKIWFNNLDIGIIISYSMVALYLNYFDKNFFFFILSMIIIPFIIIFIRYIIVNNKPKMMSIFFIWYILLISYFAFTQTKLIVFFTILEGNHIVANSFFDILTSGMLFLYFGSHIVFLFILWALMCGFLSSIIDPSQKKFIKESFVYLFDNNNLQEKPLNNFETIFLIMIFVSLILNFIFKIIDNEYIVWITLVFIPPILAINKENPNLQ